MGLMGKKCLKIETLSSSNVKIMKTNLTYPLHITYMPDDSPNAFLFNFLHLHHLTSVSLTVSHVFLLIFSLLLQSHHNTLIWITPLKSSFSSIIPGSISFSLQQPPLHDIIVFPSLYSPGHPLFIFPQPLGYPHLSTFCVYLESSSSFVHLFLLPRM